MAGEINVGTLQAVLTLVDEMSNPATKVGQALQQLANQTKDTEKALDGLEKKGAETAKGLDAMGVMFANIAANYLTRATDAIIGFGKAAIQNAAEVKMLGHVAEYMGEKVGLSKDQVHSLVDTLNKQGITMKQSNDTVVQFVKSNLDLTKATQLAGLAQSAARVGNMNSSAALQRLIHGIQTQQTETLRTVGITIQIEKATKDYALTLGKSAANLTAAERQQAVFNAVLKEGEKIQGVYGITMKDAAGKMQSMTRLIEDAGVKMGLVLQPAYEAAVNTLYNFWKAVAAAPEKFMAFGAAIAAAGLLVKTAWAAPLLVATVAFEAFMFLFTGTLDPIENFKVALGWIGDYLLWVAENYKTATGGLLDFKLAFENLNLLPKAFEYAWSGVKIFFMELGWQFYNLGAKAMEFEAAMLRMAAKLQFGAAKQASLDAAAAFEQQAAALRKSADTTEQAIVSEYKHRDAIVKGIDTTKSFTEKLKENYDAYLKKREAEAKAAETARKAAEETQRHEAAVKKLTETLTDMGRARTQAQGLADLRGAIAGVGGVSKLSEAEVVRFAAEMSKLGPKGKDAAEALRAGWTKANDGIVLLSTSVRQFNQLMATPAKYQTFDDKVLAQAQAIKKELDAQTESIEVQKAALDQLYATNQINGSQYEDGLRRVGVQTTSVTEKTIDWQQSLQTLANIAQGLGGTFGNILGSIATAVAGIGASLKNAGGIKGLFDSFKGGFAGIASGLGTIAGIASTVINVGKGIWDSLFGKKKEKEVSALRDEFVKSAGGLEELKRRAKEAGVSLDALFAAKDSKKGVQAAIDAVNKGLDDWQRKQDQIKEGNDLLNSAMEKYGITIDQLGPKFAQQKLDEQAKALYQDWLILTQAGVDMNLLIEKMGPGMMEYVNTAVAAGATIPQAMKPAIDALYQNGQLLHANGEAYTEAEYQALQYGKTQEEMFTTLIDKITQLVNAMLGIPTEINTNININEHRRTYNEEVGAGGGGGGPRRDYDDVPMATGGIITRPTRVLAGEAGAEAIIPLSQAGGALGMSAEDFQAAVRQQTRELAKVFRDAVLQTRG